jgi:hypothetical protein
MNFLVPSAKLTNQKLKFSLQDLFGLVWVVILNLVIGKSVDLRRSEYFKHIYLLSVGSCGLSSLSLSKIVNDSGVRQSLLDIAVSEVDDGIAIRRHLMVNSNRTRYLSLDTIVENHFLSAISINSLNLCDKKNRNRLLCHQSCFEQRFENPSCGRCAFYRRHCCHI